MKKKRNSKRRQRSFHQSDHDIRVFLRKPGKLKIRWKWRMWIRGLGLVATYYGWSKEGPQSHNFDTPRFLGAQNFEICRVA